MFEVWVKGIDDDDFELVKTFDTRSDAEEYVVEWKMLETEPFIDSNIEFKIVHN